MIDAKRAEWRRLAEAATPGPWDVLLPAEYHCTPLVVRRGVQVRDGGEVASTNENSGQAHDAPFLAAAREAVPTLLDEVERLTRERDEARAETARLVFRMCDCVARLHGCPGHIRDALLMYAQPQVTGGWDPLEEQRRRDELRSDVALMSGALTKARAEVERLRRCMEGRCPSAARVAELEAQLVRVSTYVDIDALRTALDAMEGK